MLDERVLDLDLAREVEAIAAAIRRQVTHDLRRRGIVVGVSGGIDSSTTLALAVRALGPERVFGLLMPERHSSSASVELGTRLCEHLGVAHTIEDIEPTLAAIGCYRRYDAAMAEVFPGYGDGWRSKIVLPGDLLDSDRMNVYRAVAEDPSGRRHEARMPVGAYLAVVAATNFKQRIRKTLEYYHADRLNHAVAGTPNRLEYDQGFFVKNGDGAADLKPIAHLYKTQVYALARHLGLPREICDSVPSTDTYGLDQGQDEFYFVLPYRQMDLLLWARNHGIAASAAAADLDLTAPQVERVYRDIDRKRAATRPLHLPPLLAGEVPEIGQRPRTG
jgi:NAD+ synthase